MSNAMTFGSDDDDLGGAFGRPYQTLFGPAGIVPDWGAAMPASQAGRYDPMFGPQLLAAAESDNPTPIAIGDAENGPTPIAIGDAENGTVQAGPQRDDLTEDRLKAIF